MNKLILFSNADRDQLISYREGETKFGEHIQVLTNTQPIYEQLQKLDVDHVIFGIPEDIGVIANQGISGAYDTWSGFIKFLLNIQSNRFTNPGKVAILGHLDFTEELALIASNSANSNHIEKTRTITSEIDSHVSQIVYDIVSAGKKPIIIGGGHNNAYGNIKGSARALDKKVNAINLDAHTDLRAQEGRHSGNGFTYALSEGFLDKYFVFGIHENYTSQSILNKMDSMSHQIDYNTFESIFVRRELDYEVELKRALNFVRNDNFGIELDCDAIQSIPSSAMTPSGVSVIQARHFLHTMASHKNAIYLHLCEAAPKLAPAEYSGQVWKLLVYLVTDFIRATTK